MAPSELKTSLQQPFEPFRIVLTDGETYDIQHPDLLWVGLETAYVGITGKQSQTLFERSVKVDLRHVVRIEPLASRTKRRRDNGAR